MVDARDVAGCAIAALTDPHPADQAWQLTGPRGVTFDDVAAHLGARYLPIPPRAAGRMLTRRGVPAVQVDHAVRMSAYFAAGADRSPTEDVQRLTGHPARPVQALLDEHRVLFAPATRLARRLSRTPTPEA
jgi:nucleoside-diphosphate-sugar epimerase